MEADSLTKRVAELEKQVADLTLKLEAKGKKGGKSSGSSVASLGLSCLNSSSITGEHSLPSLAGSAGSSASKKKRTNISDYFVSHYVDFASKVPESVTAAATETSSRTQSYAARTPEEKQKSVAHNTWKLLSKQADEVLASDASDEQKKVHDQVRALKAEIRQAQQSELPKKSGESQASSSAPATDAKELIPRDDDSEEN